MREESLQHREQVTKNSNYVLQWSKTDETGAGVAVNPQDTMIHTVQHKGKKCQGHTHVNTVRTIKTKTQMDTVDRLYTLRIENKEKSAILHTAQTSSSLQKANKYTNVWLYKERVATAFTDTMYRS